MFEKKEIIYKGKVYSSIKDLANDKEANIHNIKAGTIYARLKGGWDADRVLDEIDTRYGRAVPVTGPDGKEYPSFSQLAKTYGISSQALKYFMDKGDSVETAIEKSKNGRRRIACVGPDGKEYVSAKALGDAYGVPRNRLLYAVEAYGMTPAEAVTYYVAKSHAEDPDR